jgi:hypothetical protein
MAPEEDTRGAAGRGGGTHKNMRKAGLPTPNPLGSAWGPSVVGPTDADGAKESKDPGEADCAPSASGRVLQRDDQDTGPRQNSSP